MSENYTKVRVLVVDDSAYLRQTISQRLARDAAIDIAGVARDGTEALAKIAVLKPDVVTLDVEMPGLDGLATLQRIMAECPTPVVMLSAHTASGTSTTIKALMRGAVDFVPKPGPGVDFQDTVNELLTKIKMAARTRPPAPLHVAAPRPPKSTLRPLHMGDPLIIIGTSTGGPRSLQQLLGGLPADLPAAVVVVQHIAAGFTQSLAQRLHETTALTVQEAADGDRLARGLVLIAPGDFHLRFRRNQVIRDQGPRRNHVRPAVDVTMESAVEQQSRTLIGVILTGMGTDGTAGARAIKAAGGIVIAEHASTSVVYGMPGSVVAAGLADKVLPLPEIAPALVELVHGSLGI